MLSHKQIRGATIIRREIKKRTYGYNPAIGGVKASVFVYSFRCQAYAKIGITSHIPSRLGDLQAGNPIELKCELFRSISPHKAAQLEHLVHCELRPYYHQGEWFECDKETVKLAFRSADSLLRKIERLAGRTKIAPDNQNLPAL